MNLLLKMVTSMIHVTTVVGFVLFINFFIVIYAKCNKVGE